mmetsp:Transcript_4323/g.7584  ORF Transcript_4323/g.7584 Transcript_4323/m.7584 type:complete len:87 (+) Transcript_4323:245-505(+)
MPFRQDIEGSITAHACPYSRKAIMQRLPKILEVFKQQLRPCQSSLQSVLLVMAHIRPICRSLLLFSMTSVRVTDKSYNDSTLSSHL